MTSNQNEQNITVLITGGLGFIASHFLNRYAIEFPGHQIICIDKISYVSRKEYVNPDLWSEFNQWKTGEKDHPRFLFFECDLADQQSVKAIWDEHPIHKVFHFAAESHVDNSFDNSFHFTESNVLGTNILLECARKYRHNVSLFLHVSTDEVYGGDADSATEETLLAPTNPYAASKMAAEAFVMAYEKSYNIPAIITRCNNVYGPHQYPEKVIPKFTMAMLNGTPMTVHGQGQTKRSFIYIDDVIDAYMVIIKQGKLGQVYNIGLQPFREWSIMEVIDLLSEEMGIADPKVQYVQDRPFNDKRYSIDSTKLRALGWKPDGTQFVPIREGIKKTVAWIKENKGLFD